MINSISGGSTFAGISAFVSNNHRAILGQMTNIASGLAVMRPADGAADYFMGRKLDVQARAFDAIRRQLQEASALLDVAEGSMTEIFSDLTGMRDLVRRYFDSNTQESERNFITLRINELQSLVQHTVENTVYNGRHLLKDSSQNPLVEIAINPNSRDNIFTITFSDIHEVNMSNFDFSSFKYGEDALDAVNEQLSRAAKFLGRLSGSRTGLNAQRNLSELARNNSLDQRQNVLGTNDAQEIFTMTRRQIQQQAAMSMLSQGNAMRTSVLSLLNF